MRYAWFGVGAKAPSATSVAPEPQVIVGTARDAVRLARVTRGVAYGYVIDVACDPAHPTGEWVSL